MQPPARPDPYARRLRVAYESADASPGGQLTAEGLTMKPHIYRLARVLVLHQIQLFASEELESSAKGDSC